MPGTVQHALSMTTPDDTRYENRPSHWNQTHGLTLSLTGSEISGAFSNANGVSFGLSAGAVTASHNALTTAALSNHSHGNPTLNLTNLSGTTASNSAGFTLSLSAAAGGGGADGVNVLAAGTQTANTTGTVLFSDSNGITFGMSNSSIVTASHNGLTTAMASNRGSDFVAATAAFAGTSASGTIASSGISVSIGPYITTAMLSNAVTLSNIRVSGGTTSNLLSALTFGDANGISFGLNASTLTASHNALTSQSNQNVTAGNGGFAFQTLSFSNANNFSFGTSAGSAITGSYTVPTITSWTASDNATSLTIARLAFTNANGVTLTLSTTTGGSATVVGSHNGLTSQSNQAFSAGAASSTFQTLSFQDSNGLSFSNNAGAIRATYTRNVASNAIQSVGSATGSGTNTSRFAADDHVHAGVFSMGVSNLGNTAGDTRVDVGRFVLQGSNLTLSQITAANALNTIVVSAAAPGAAAVTQSIGMSTQTAGGATGGTTGYATGDDVLYHFVPGSNITMSQSVNGASATLSIYGPAAGGGATLSGWNPFAHQEVVAFAGGQASLWIDKLNLPCAMQFDRVGIHVTHSNATNSSGSATISAWAGFYTRNASTLSLLASTSFSTGLTQSGTVGSYSHYAGIKILPIPWTTTMSENNYWFGYITRTTTGGANMTFGNLGISQIASTWSGFFGSASNATNHSEFGVGVYSATTAGLPSSIPLTAINGNSSAFARKPTYQFLSNIF